MSDIKFPKVSLSWAEALPSASSMFEIWTDGNDRAWGEWAWKALANVGGTSYSNPVELCEVQLRLIALHTMFCDFSHLAYQERYEWQCQLADWASELAMDQVSLGRLLGKDQSPESERLADIMSCLLPVYREQIFRMLVESLGSKDLLYVSFGTSMESPKKLSTIKITSPLSRSLFTGSPWAEAYEWVDEGCPAQ